MKTVVGLVASHQEAEDLIKKLRLRGIKTEDIIRVGEKPEGGQKQRAEEGFFCSVEGFFGTEEELEVRGYYAEAVRRGGVLISVFVEDEDVDRAAEIMIGHGLVDIKRLADLWKKSGCTGLDQNPAPNLDGTGKAFRPRCEPLNKQEVVGGKVRVYDHSA